jgi:ubiquinone/menaquinone biosynthesis C-methylase UbiE
MKWYSILNNSRIDFLNLGYQKNSFSIPTSVSLTEHNPDNLRQITLYCKLLQHAQPNAAKALEVGCGFGGGTYLIKQYLQPQLIIGIDVLKSSVVTCAKKFERSNEIEFLHYSSDNMNLLPHKFDMIISLEASQHFAHMPLFFKNVHHLLNKEGIFYYADIFEVSDLLKTKKQIADAGMYIKYEEDISEGVINSLNATPRSQSLMGKLEKLLLKRHGIDLLPGGELYKKFVAGNLQYVTFEIGKQ